MGRWPTSDSRGSDCVSNRRLCGVCRGVCCSVCWCVCVGLCVGVCAGVCCGVGVCVAVCATVCVAVCVAVCAAVCELGCCCIVRSLRFVSFKSHSHTLTDILHANGDVPKKPVCCVHSCLHFWRPHLQQQLQQRCLCISFAHTFLTSQSVRKIIFPQPLESRLGA